MYIGIIGSPCIEKALPAAVAEATAPASLMPSCSSWPDVDSL